FYRRRGGRWSAVSMELLGNDRWRGEFKVEQQGFYHYCIEGWIDNFATWARHLRKRIEAGQEIEVELTVGAELLRVAARRAKNAAAERLKKYADQLQAGAQELAFAPQVERLVERSRDRSHATRSLPELRVAVDRERARFSTWYELFPRSWGSDPGRHGTFQDLQQKLPYVAEMGFDVLYLPPIHPIGRAYRKGPNNSQSSSPDDLGSPWAIGGAEGGHTEIHPQLGTMEDFRELLQAAHGHGMEVALDIALQVSPDHPWVSQHPQWFRHRPDGSIQYAENPPKKYQDIYPLDFSTRQWRGLYREVLRVFEFWIEAGVRIFRVDNPHTKPFAFWEWLIDGLRRRHPDVILLAEAFTYPKVMSRLAKLGFQQSYTYFTWRSTSAELREYLSELTSGPQSEFMRPNLWVNTPDILSPLLQDGGRSASALRYVLAATLGASCGIYGPGFELGEVTPLVPGKEEYLDSEKYQLRWWDLDQPDSLRPLITRVNQIRRQHPALQQNRTLRFLPTDQDHFLAYAKTAADGSDLIVTVVNLDPHHRQAGWVGVPLQIESGSYPVNDLLNDVSYTWQAESWNYVELDPAQTPAHILSIPLPLQNAHNHG
ncbi:MAG: maltotransferase domain-containing protein, partial [Candidatus Dormibacteraceae bacterium]